MKRLKGARSPDYRLVKIKSEHGGFGLYKTMLALAFLLLQFAILFSLHLYVVSAVRWYLILCYIVSIITAIYVLSSNRNAQSKAVWVLFILTAFIFGYFVFWLSDDRLVYYRQRKRHHAIFSGSKGFVAPYSAVNLSNDVKTDVEYLYRVGRFVPYCDAAATYYPSGAQWFDEALNALKSAQKFIFIEFFIVDDGVLFDRIWEVLQQKLLQGVDVRMIYDDMGTGKVIRLKTLKQMKKAGVKTYAFNRLLARFSFALNYRDHRKLILIDGKTAFIGGCNLADEYINEKRAYGYWKDIGAKITGSAVDAFALTFLRQWEFVSKKPVNYANFIRLYDKTEGDGVLVPYAGGPEYTQPVCKGIYQKMITGARKKLYIFTPYFVPDDAVMENLKTAALSGVDVRIVLPDVPDKRYVYMLSLDSAERLLDSGVKVYKLRDSFVHAKGVLTEHCAAISSANFDMRSFYQQFENGLYTDSATFMAEMERDFEGVFQDCVLLEKPQKRSVPYRIGCGILRILLPLM